ncbi:hypothetical protein P5V15_014085 [Pogonomyrmex californicus]
MILSHLVLPKKMTRCNNRFWKLSRIHMSVDDILYNVQSTMEVIDICFKVFHVLGLSYPITSEHIWFLIQNCIYKFTKWDILFQIVNTL